MGRTEADHRAGICFRVPCCARSPGYGNVEAREKFVHDFVAAGNKEMNRIALLCVIVEVVKQKPRNDVGAFPM